MKHWQIMLSKKQRNPIPLDCCAPELPPRNFGIREIRYIIYPAKGRAV